MCYTNRSSIWRMHSIIQDKTGVIKVHLYGRCAHFCRPRRSEQPRWLVPCGTRPLKQRTVFCLQPLSPAALPPSGHVSVPQMQLLLQPHQENRPRQVVTAHPTVFCWKRNESITMDFPFYMLKKLLIYQLRLSSPRVRLAKMLTPLSHERNNISIFNSIVTGFKRTNHSKTIE